ncbi:uncharacterized protein BCR38DRAFT_414968 [Pseudomassariella vexata]|uniref:Uncharacterized protein n=1 Tax=Pseudomassariella vexata TaxID=1141098 RepID=A0A1Y2D7I9_9PEZI|nr:uncharacterized protein BCR38DRAFT_414968 [Pseudomassariella vexata]ORY55241.1 hypothetical protein BCR38DRAFT_414968 [Pseudomassariella vexata]
MSSCPITSIPALLETSCLYNHTSDFTWLALQPTTWLEVSYNLSVITACIPSLKGAFDIWLGNTMRLDIDAPYQLNRVAGKIGLEAAAYEDNHIATDGMFRGASRIRVSKVGRSIRAEFKPKPLEYLDRDGYRLAPTLRSRRDDDG